MLEQLFCVSATIDENYRKPHYPKYKTRDVQIGVATSLERAVEILKANVNDELSLTNVHHFTVREVLSDETYYWWEHESIRVYDKNGDLIDQCLIQDRTDICGKFHGRKAEDIRFNPGDIVEVFNGDEISLAFVAYVPPSEEKAARCKLDCTDDCYVVLTNEDYRYHDHVDSVCLFKPQHKIHPGIKARLRNAYHGFQTFEKRQDIAMKTSLALLKSIAEDIGAEAIAKPYYYEYIDLELRWLQRKGKELRIRIDADKAIHHLDRIRISLYRLAGLHVKGRGYGLSSNKDSLDFDYTI